MGKARVFSEGANEAVYQSETNNENYTLTQQSSYNLGNVHFSDQSGIGNFGQSSNQRFIKITGGLFQGNIGFDLQTAVLDTTTDTIDLLEDGASVALSQVSTDRIVTISSGTTADLETILGPQRPGQRLYLYGISGNTITIKNTAAATANTILTPDGNDFDFSDTMVIELVYDITTTQWRVVSGVSGGGGSDDLLSSNNTWTGTNTFENTVTITGSPFTVSGAITTLASTTSTSINSPLIAIGDNTTDSITFTARVDNNGILPINDNAANLGSTANEWNTLWATGINATTETTIASPLLTITSGLTTFGDAATDIVNFVGVIGSSLIPNLDLSYDLGSASQEWNNLFVGTINAFTETTISSPILSIDSPLTNLGDSSSDNISFLGQVNTNIVMEEISEPGSASANTGRFYAKESGGVSVPFWKDEAGTETSMIAAGGSQTPWTSDIDADGYNLQDLGALEFRADETAPSSNNYIYKQTVNMVYTVDSGDGHLFYSGTTQGLGIGLSSVNIYHELDMNTEKITDVVDPTDAQDAATKNYVDNASDFSGLQDAVFGTDHETSQLDVEWWISNTRQGDLDEDQTVGKYTAAGEETIYYMPIYIGRAIRIERVGVDIGTVDIDDWSMAIYDSYGDQPYPQTRITNSTNQFFNSTGINSILFNEDVDPGLYFIAFWKDNGNTSTMRYYAGQNAHSVAWMPTNTDSGFMRPIHGYLETGQTSSTLPSTADNDMLPLYLQEVPAVYAKLVEQP